MGGVWPGCCSVRGFLRFDLATVELMTMRGDHELYRFDLCLEATQTNRRGFSTEVTIPGRLVSVQWNVVVL